MNPALNLEVPAHSTGDVQALSSLSDWLAYMERIHPQSIAMGLDRVLKVKKTLKLDPAFPIITVAGTNGKGSTCAMLEAVLHAAGYSVGSYTSPHLQRFNERVRVGLAPASDAALIEAFGRIENARGDTPLTYFEFATLAAAVIFSGAKLDAAVLEVGLGGRLDAVNAFDGDCAIVTSVAMDHMDYLGDTREQIGFEKAGIFRGGKPAICADSDPPASAIAHAKNIGADWQCLGHDFSFTAETNEWRFSGRRGRRSGLPAPALRGAYQLHNACAALAALDELRAALPVTMNDIRAGLVQVELPGRFQILPGRPLLILDVAHNPHAAASLAANLKAMRHVGKTLAVFAMLGDKDIHGVIGEVKSEIDEWHVAGISDRRGAPREHIERELERHGIRPRVFSSIVEAYEHAVLSARDSDRILVFGSFHTVGDVLRHRALL
ncbi:MAG: bifunctional tetrahydrofolate synthase/dihydrofolate synthase [Burkholderiales bacterium]